MVLFSDSNERNSSAKAEQEIPYRIIIFTAPERCQPCKVLEKQINNMRPSLLKAGWKIGQGNKNHIQILNADDNQQMVRLYNIEFIPQICLIDERGGVKGKVIDKLEEPVTIRSITGFYNRTK